MVTNWTNRSKPSSSWDNRDAGIENYLLAEDDNFLTFQDGSLIVLSNYSQWDKRDYPGITWKNLEDRWVDCLFTWQELGLTNWTNRI